MQEDFIEFCLKHKERIHSLLVLFDETFRFALKWTVITGLFIATNLGASLYLVSLFFAKPEPIPTHSTQLCGKACGGSGGGGVIMRTCEEGK